MSPKKRLEELKVSALVEAEDSAPEPEPEDVLEDGDTPLPAGTVLKLDTTSYLWDVMGHVGLEIPVTKWSEVDTFIESWYEYQAALKDALAEELDSLRGTQSKDAARPIKRDFDTDPGYRKKLMGVIYGLGTERGIYIKKQYPDIQNYSIDDLKQLIKELEEMPPAANESRAPDARIRSRFSRARSS